MHIAAFIGKLQHFENLKPSYLSTYKWVISPILSDQVTYTFGRIQCYIQLKWLEFPVKHIMNSYRAMNKVNSFTPNIYTPLP